jgi:peptidoglycan/LPS O-acetylase OafA/YrhL
MIFFVLSGFLMSYHYLPSQFSVRYWLSFWVHRFIRVYPPFFFAVFGYLFFRGHLPSTFPLANSIEGLPRLLDSWFLREWSGIFWTIPVEIKFYIIYPLIAFAIASSSIVKKTFRVFFLGLILFLVYIESPRMIPYFLFFFCGVIASVFFKNNFTAKIKPLAWEILAWFSILACIFYVYCFRFLDVSNNHLWSYSWAYAPLLSITLFCIAKCQGLIYKIFANSLSRLVGRYSYSLYLVHFFVIQFFVVAKIKISWLVLVPIFLSAWIFYKLIESPSASLAKKVSQAIYKKPRAI